MYYILEKKQNALTTSSLSTVVAKTVDMEIARALCNELARRAFGTAYYWIEKRECIYIPLSDSLYHLPRFF